MVITPLFINNSTPFLRWSSGDIVSLHDQSNLAGPFSIFPVMRHARRTVGFFKVRGVNINHSEFEDFMFRISEVNDFKVEILNEGGSDILYLGIELKRGSNAQHAEELVENTIRQTFEVRPEVDVLEIGTLAKEFESSVKAPRFVDKRN